MKIKNTILLVFVIISLYGPPFQMVGPNSEIKTGMVKSSLASDAEGTPALVGQKAAGQESTAIKKPGPPSFRIDWNDEDQKARCEVYLEGVRASFYKARLYCMQNDACQCIRHADKFLEPVEKCKDECPEDYLEKNGYSQRLQKNVFWLKNSKA